MTVLALGMVLAIQIRAGHCQRHWTVASVFRQVCQGALRHDFALLAGVLLFRSWISHVWRSTILGCNFAQQLLGQVLRRRRSRQQQLLLMQLCNVETVGGDALRHCSSGLMLQ